MSLFDTVWAIVAPVHEEAPTEEAATPAQQAQAQQAQHRAGAATDVTAAVQGAAVASSESSGAGAACDAFAGHVTAVHLALAERRPAAAVAALLRLRAVAPAGPGGGGGSNTSSSSGSSGGGGGGGDDSMSAAVADVTADLARRTGGAAAAALSRMGEAGGAGGAPTFAAGLALWRGALAAGAGAGGGVQAAFCGSLRALFAEAATDVLRGMDVVRSQQAGNSGSGQVAPCQPSLLPEPEPEQVPEPEPAALVQRSPSDDSRSSGGGGFVAAAASFMFSGGLDDTQSSPLASPVHAQAEKFAVKLRNVPLPPHAYLFHHQRALQLALAGGSSRGRVDDDDEEDDASADEREAWAAVRAVASSAPPHMEERSGGCDAGLAASQPHIEALNTVLGDGSTLLLALHGAGSDSDGGARVPACELAEALRVLHDEVTRAVLSVLAAYRADTQLDATLLVAGEVLHAALGADTALLRDACAAAGMPESLAPPAPPSCLPGAGMRLGRRPLRLSLPGVAPFAPAASAGAAAPAAATPPSSPAVLPVDIAVSIVDEAADQLSFICQLLERYTRCAAFCLRATSAGGGGSGGSGGGGGGGGGGGPSDALGARDALCLAMWELQGQYVALERSYVLTSVRLALAPPAGWARAAVHDDARVRTFAWCDNAFFLLSKAVARASSTCSDMAAAAVTNYVAGVCGDILERTLRLCVAASGLVADAADPRLRAGHLRGLLQDALTAAANDSGSSVAVESLLAMLRLRDDDTDEGGAAAPVAATPATAWATVGDAARAPGSAQQGKRGGGGGGGGGGSGIDDDVVASLRAAFAESAAAAAAAASPDGEGEAAPAVAASATARSVFDLPEAPGAGDAAPAAAGSAAAATAAAAAAAAAPPVLSETALLALNSVSTAGSYAAALHERTAAELAAAFPHAEAVLAPPLQQLREAARALQALASAAAGTAAAAAAAAGLRVLRGVLRALDYAVPSAAAFEAARGADALLAAAAGPLLAGTALHATLPRLLQPAVSDALVLALGQRLASALEARWAAARTTEYGALLMSAQLRALHALLAPLVRAGAAGAALRGVLAGGSRLQQMAEVLGIEALADLATLAFPTPALSRAEVCALLAHRVGFLPLPAAQQQDRADPSAAPPPLHPALAAVAWHRVPITDAAHYAPTRGKAKPNA